MRRYALLRSEPRSATISVVEDAAIYALDRVDFDLLVGPVRHLLEANLAHPQFRLAGDPYKGDVDPAEVQLTLANVGVRSSQIYASSDEVQRYAAVIA